MIADPLETRESLIVLVYPELREMAARLLRRERPDHTLQRTALVHEAFIKLFGNVPLAGISVNGFLALAAHKMREILIDHGRRRLAGKRGGTFRRVPLLDIGQHLAQAGLPGGEHSMLALNQALARLGAIDPRALSVVELKFFCGFTNAETAGILEVSSATVEMDWQFARSWLFGALSAKTVRPATLFG